MTGGSWRRGQSLEGGENSQTTNGWKTAKRNDTLGGKVLKAAARADCFALHFLSKLKLSTSKVVMDKGVYNGKNKLLVIGRNFMKKSDVKECSRLLNPPKSEGFDRIPVNMTFMSRLNLNICRGSYVTWGSELDKARCDYIKWINVTVQ